MHQQQQQINSIQDQLRHLQHQAQSNSLMLSMLLTHFQLAVPSAPTPPLPSSLQPFASIASQPLGLSAVASTTSQSSSTTSSLLVHTSPSPVASTQPVNASHVGGVSSHPQSMSPPPAMEDVRELNDDIGSNSMSNTHSPVFVEPSVRSPIFPL